MSKKWKGFSVGDHVIINGPDNWQGQWDEVPATVQHINPNRVGYITLKLLREVKGWHGKVVSVDSPEFVSHAKPLETLVLEVLGNDYL